MEDVIKGSFTIRLCIEKSDVPQMERIFKEDAEPSFTIISVTDAPDYGEGWPLFVFVDLFVSSPTSLWCLAKQVRVLNEHDSHMASIEKQYDFLNKNKSK